ncbi:hypothetical protein [endosymbiont 'TC1' of Trimyema compressum]|nr:hypothetical protein [endosymbiont 'TC1' of Trimyema compressum]
MVSRVTYKDSPDVFYNRIMRFVDDDLPATEKVFDNREFALLVIE